MGGSCSILPSGSSRWRRICFIAQGGHWWPENFGPLSPASNAESWEWPFEDECTARGRSSLQRAAPPHGPMEGSPDAGNPGRRRGMGGGVIAARNWRCLVREYLAWRETRSGVHLLLDCSVKAVQMRKREEEQGKRLNANAREKYTRTSHLAEKKRRVCTWQKHGSCKLGTETNQETSTY